MNQNRIIATFGKFNGLFDSTRIELNRFINGRVKFDEGGTVNKDLYFVLQSLVPVIGQAEPFVGQITLNGKNLLTNPRIESCPVNPPQFFKNTQVKEFFQPLLRRTDTAIRFRSRADKQVDFSDIRKSGKNFGDQYSAEKARPASD